jgi:hypothetical protein
MTDLMKIPRYAGPTKQLAFPDHGFGEHEVPEMPAFIDRYSKRGNSIDADQTPVYQQARFGNRTGKGGMGGYLSQVEDQTFFEGLPVKKGDAGVFPLERWSPGYDWRGGFGIASLSETKNYAGISDRGGGLRKGGPRRGDVVERTGAYQENLRPGRSTSRFVQSNDNYSGLYDWQRRTPSIQRETDALVLDQMIRLNPYHISSHGAAQAQALVKAEFGDAGYEGQKAFQDNYPAGYRAQSRFITETDLRILNSLLCFLQERKPVVLNAG